MLFRTFAAIVMLFPVMAVNAIGHPTDDHHTGAGLYHSHTKLPPGYKFGGEMDGHANLPEHGGTPLHHHHEGNEAEDKAGDIVLGDGTRIPYRNHDMINDPDYKPPTPTITPGHDSAEDLDLTPEEDARLIGIDPSIDPDGDGAVELHYRLVDGPRTLQLTIDFGQSVTGFTEDDIIVRGTGDVDITLAPDPQGQSTSYSLMVEETRDVEATNVTIIVPADAAQSDQGVGNSRIVYHIRFRNLPSLTTSQQQSVQGQSVTPDPNLVNQPGVAFREGTPSQTSNAQAVLPQDVNSDGNVDNDDLLDIALHFGKTPEGDLARYDLDGDGDIDVDDFQLAQAQMTERAPGAPAAIHTLSDTLTHIKGLDITDPRLQRVVQLLENQLAELAPKKTVLLANYPNPFNPETWIPYRLANDTDVRIIIYDGRGTVVRHLDLGHQSAGTYTDRSRAAYWDGRNMSGEHVASSVYFYHLSAGDYSATRRMLILK